MLHVKITSAISGKTWEGETDIGDGVTNPAIVNEWLFRLFNRVENADRKRLAEWGYTLPSLMTGDTVEWGGRKWKCLRIGWEEVK